MSWPCDNEGDFTAREVKLVEQAGMTYQPGWDRAVFAGEGRSLYLLKLGKGEFMVGGNSTGVQATKGLPLAVALFHLGENVGRLKLKYKEKYGEGDQDA